MSDLIHKSQIYELLGQSGKKDIHVSDIDLLPTVDAVPVVRCKDCVYSRERNSYEKEYLVEGVVICTNDDVHDDAWGAMYRNDFCSYGERKDGDE